MRKLVFSTLIALLVGAFMVTTAHAYVTTKSYSKPVKVHAGNDSFYVGHGAAVGTDSTTFTLYFTASAHVAENTNWLAIDELWVPDFLESYCDTTWTAITARERPGAGDRALADSLVAYGSSTSWHSWPIAMRIGAWVTSKAATTDSIMVAVQCSMDKIGYKTVWRDVIEPGAGTTPEILSDATTTKRVMGIPAGKLYGWNYMRLQVTGDKNHKGELGCKLYHYYRTWQPIKDADE